MVRVPPCAFFGSPRTLSCLPYPLERDNKTVSSLQYPASTAPPPAPPTDHLAEAARQRAELLARVEHRVPDVRVSQYPGTCPSCRLPIQAGRDQITNALRDWAHLACSACVTCGNWVTAADSAPVPDGVGRVHHACVANATTDKGDAR